MYRIYIWLWYHSHHYSQVHCNTIYLMLEYQLDTIKCIIKCIKRGKKSKKTCISIFLVSVVKCIELRSQTNQVKNDWSQMKHCIKDVHSVHHILEKKLYQHCNMSIALNSNWRENYIVSKRNEMYQR